MFKLKLNKLKPTNSIEGNEAIKLVPGTFLKIIAPSEYYVGCTVMVTGDNERTLCMIDNPLGSIYANNGRENLLFGPNVKGYYFQMVNRYIENHNIVYY